ncbi:lipopolysaccharide transport periplasmic protein LptA [Litorilituus lipolyticus]|uniref:Lipopolysaccharide export system protein LptA n=2 Tax=Litorilituus lipolyticus TaxID=2491017 RepID=A0A502L6A0_9GAMM|nr:lipopolysaccharide transport periplasmic protein LptA [Litorilituus lipolyticus]
MLFSHSTLAAKKDLEQEITIKSQRQSADLKNKIASYLDDVNIQQGSISIKADIVQVFSNNKDTEVEKADIYLAKGKPAIFQQQLEDGSLISLQADEIKYQPNINLITVSGNAVVKQAGSEVSGSKITYNTLNEKLEAESNSNEAVTTILQPTILKNQKDKKDKKDKKKQGDNSDNN